ncbi:hypothetical protein [Qipengyuania sp. JC766]|uniref:hypothetical protein n=1 Tax=Qipengyuania sp. JC766 TaxID=3232139 RepID=UPI0034597310
MAACVLAVGLAVAPAPARAQTKDQCDAAYLAIFDALDHRGPNKPYVSEEAQEWALDYQGRHRRGELCDTLPPGYPPAEDAAEDPLAAMQEGTAALRSLVAETAFKSGMVNIREGYREAGIASFKKACDLDHADGCYAYATYLGLQMSDFEAPEVVATTQKACRLGSEEACESERERTGAAR